MKVLYIDCGMGAAGDMFTAALLELFDNKAEIVKRLNNIGIPGIEFVAESSLKCGISGTHMHVLINGTDENDHHHDDHDDHSHHHDDYSHHHDDHSHHHDDHSHHHDDHAHHHASMAEIEAIIASLNVSDTVKRRSMDVYKLIADAESRVHGLPVSDIHFHEVGKMDAIADITAVCFLMEELAIDRVIASPVHLGSGTVKCAHGILPVPAPATALILEGIPVYGGEIKGELCTPTGAALLKTFADSFGNMPLMSMGKTGYGIGNKDFYRANVLRVILGDAIVNDIDNDNDCNYIRSNSPQTDRIVKLECNIDDMTPEAVGFAMEVLLAGGALDVFTVPIGMKKNRPGILLSVLCRYDDRETVAELIFKNTSTIGIRETVHNRYILDRNERIIETKLGPVHIKEVSGYGVNRFKYEYEDIAKIAGAMKVSYQDVINEINSVASVLP